MTKISLFELIEMPNGTVNIDTILSITPSETIEIKELPDKKFDVRKDREILEQLLEDYQKGGVNAIQKYGN